LQGQRLKTGQTLCYDDVGTVIACAGTGQDAELQKGLAGAYTDNGNGTITDTGTGLMWEKLSDDGTIHDKDTAYTWLDAFSTKVAMLTRQLRRVHRPACRTSMSCRAGGLWGGLPCDRRGVQHELRGDVYGVDLFLHPVQPTGRPRPTRTFPASPGSCNSDGYAVGPAA
jgi:hypothetical protein